jgi:hypothetical protein
LANRYSTDTAGVAQMLGLQASANVTLEALVAKLESKLSDATLLSI